jgi:uncharacterized protein YjbI with pentapeptide repeats
MDSEPIPSNIVSSTTNFDFNTISLADPEPLHNNAGFYFTRLGLGIDNEPLYFQLPECKTKQGIVSIKNSKYLDLMFNRSDNNDLMSWVEQLEYRCQDIINAKKELWFQTELTRDDIETMMAQMIRLYQSGKYMLIRSVIETNKLDKSIKCIAYDENEFGFDLEQLQPEQSIIPLLLIEGVKFSSRSFEISIKLIQVMVIGDIKQKTSCLIKRNKLNESMQIAASNSIPEKQALVLGQVSVNEVSVNDVNLNEVSVNDVNLNEVNLNEVNLNEVNLNEAIAKSNKKNNKPEILLEEKIKMNNQTIPNKISDKTNTQTSQKSLKINENTILSVPILDNIKQTSEPDFLEEVTLDIDNSIDESINLKNPNEVYYELYQKARENAKEYRMKAMESYLEAKRIKSRYMLFDIDESDDSDDENNI